ncbi:MAG TPA: ABC transporter substrate-binding protein [Candidatus Nanoarchaeia archaeon]|nr:ABC transporter substrate-binding protein [Candidatus Nanoarchaeia archaeon]
MNKLTIIGLFLSILLIIAGCSTEKVTLDNKQTIKIGAVVPLTGGAAFLGEGTQKALTLAKEQLGNTQYNYEIIFEDDALDPKQSATAAQKLINVDGVDVLISISSGTGNIVAALAQENKIIHFGIASDPAVAKGDYNFIHWTPPEEENPAFIQELQRRNIKTFAVLEMNHPWINAAMPDLKKRLQGTGITLTSEQVYNSGDRDFKTLILKAEKTKPEIYLLMGFTPEIEIIAKQMKELGIKTPLTSIESFELTEQPELFEGYWYIQAADPTAAFLEDYDAKYGEAPKLGGPNAYDIFNMIVQGYEEAGTTATTKPERTDVINSLNNIKSFKGAMGTLNMGEEGIVQSKAIVRIIKNGKPTTLR